MIDLLRGWFGRSQAFSELAAGAVVKATLLLLVALQALDAAAGQETIQSAARSNVGEIERKLAAAIEQARSSAVRIAWGKEEREGNCSGVIIDEKGHVATSGRKLMNSGSTVVFYLSDGRRATGKVLGASWELGVGLMKLDGDGPWPHATIGQSMKTPLGALCLALGYPALHWGGPLQYELQPLPRLGQVICTAAAPTWLLTSCRLSGDDAGGGLYDLEGRLVGIHVDHRFVDAKPAEAVYAGIETLMENWDSLVAGKLPGSHFDATDNSLDGAAPADQPAALRERIANATKTARAAIVGLQYGPADREGCSGTIISADGYIATCEHHQRACGEAVLVHLSDGRSVAGTVLRSDIALDIGLMKINEAGPWPHALLGKSTDAQPGDVCISLGYPIERPDGAVPRWREPLIRVGEILNASLAPGRLAASGQLYGGDSGGGLFDGEGRLIGIHIGDLLGQRHNLAWRAGAELIESRWQFLATRKPFEILPPLGLGHTAELLTRAIGDTSANTVEILAAEKRRAIGTIVGSDGWVLTKASELGNTVTCRLADGRRLAAEVCGIDRAHDLALLKIEADHLSAISWSDDDQVNPNPLIAALGFQSAPAVGMVSRAVHAVPRQAGWLFIGGVRDGVGGVEVTDDSDAAKNGDPIHKGDIIVALEGQATPNMKSYLALTEGPGVGVVPVYAGDPLLVTIRRGADLFDLQVRVRPSVNMADRSRRRSGFASVFDTDAHVTRDQCGGPAVNRNGKVVGIVIAIDGNERAYVIPASVARNVMEPLRRDYRKSQ